MTASATVTRHRIRWSIYAGGHGQPLQRIPRLSTTRGHWPGYDAACSCGWDSGTGGAIKRAVEDAIEDHRREVAWELGRQHAREGHPAWNLEDADSALLMDLIGETRPTTSRNHPRRWLLCGRYESGYEFGRGHR